MPQDRVHASPDRRSGPQPEHRSAFATGAGDEHVLDGETQARLDERISARLELGVPTRRRVRLSAPHRREGSMRPQQCTGPTASWWCWSQLTTLLASGRDSEAGEFFRLV